MSYFVCYARRDREQPDDGPHLASNTGYYDFGTFVETRAAEFAELAHLVEHGWSDRFDALASELTRLRQQAATAEPDVASVAAELARAVAARPADAVAVMVTDGEPGDEEWAQNDGDVYG